MWRFVHLTDPHLASQRDGEWNNRFLCSMMPDVMACLVGDLACLHPEFILATGDIASKQTRAAMLEAARLMDSLGIPYYPMGGNHDLVLEESRDWFLEAFGDRLPLQRTYYSFDYRELHFVALDPWWKWSDGSLNPASEASVAADLDMTLQNARWALPPDQFAWLKEDLLANSERPTIVCCHYPAVGVPKRMQRPNYRDSGALDNGDLLLGMLRAHPQVKAIFSGHMHMNYVVELEGLTQVVTASLPEYPVEDREVQVFEDRLEVSTTGLSDSSFAARSLIPGKEWTRGDETDRSIAIPLI